jgi:hypothetical protein
VPIHNEICKEELIDRLNASTAAVKSCGGGGSDAAAASFAASPPVGCSGFTYAVNITRPVGYLVESALFELLMFGGLDDGQSAKHFLWDAPCVDTFPTSLFPPLRPFPPGGWGGGKGNRPAPLHFPHFALSPASSPCVIALPCVSARNMHVCS